MKKIFLVPVLMLISSAGFSQNIFSYGNNAVSKQEFLKAFNKNKVTITDKDKAVRDYLELYSNFKLKVKEAQDLMLDTLPQIKYDVENFRNQVAESYLNDKKSMDLLQTEAFERSKRDLHVLHFFAPINADYDSIKAKAAIEEAYAQLKKGNSNYTAIAKEITGKFSMLRQADMGYITVFNMPYEYENIIYTLKPGEYSKPYRAKNGWHIFRFIGDRPSTGKWRVAQILFSFPPDANDYSKAEVVKKADSVYALLQNGMSFAEAAKNFSDDRNTYLTEGELPEFGAGKYSDAFFTQVIELKNDGAISKPFETPFGIHILKRISHKPAVTDVADEDFQTEIKHKILVDSRVNAPKEKFIQDVTLLTGYKKSKQVNYEDLLRYADTVMKYLPKEKMYSLPVSNKTIGTFKDGSSVKGYDWLNYIKQYKTDYQQYKGESNAELLRKFAGYISLNFYKKNLEKYNEDFAFQVNEFKEGNMLFEIMERKIWGKATNDSAGLLKYYNEHKEKYKWDKSANILIFNTTTALDAQDALEDLKAGKSWHTVISEMSERLQADSGRYSLDQINSPDKNIVPQANTYSDITTNTDGTALFVKYLELFPAGQQRNFTDARGLVINDYQDLLEQQWITALKKKYPVKVNEAVVKEIIRQL